MMSPNSPHPDFGPAETRNAATLVELALAEDLGFPFPRLHLQNGLLHLDNPANAPHAGDITSNTTIPATARGSARFIARADGVIAGLPVVQLCAIRFGIPEGFVPLVADGTLVRRGQPIATITGPTGNLLALERTALNFLQRLSGVATLTRRFVDAVAGTKAQILDTRKTTPGWRALEKYAVRRGGGQNHRIGLHDAVLIKDNHLGWLASLGEPDPIGLSIARARETTPAPNFVEVEVDSLAQLDRALQCRPDIILVDNLGPETLAEAVRRRDKVAPGVQLEASGGVNLQTVRALAETGVDRISVGALTHSAPALDIALDYVEDRER